MRKVSELMTIWDFMGKPLIENALIQKDFDRLKEISNLNIISEQDDIVCVLGKSIDWDAKELFEKQTKGMDGSTCKLYKKCSKCQTQVFYHKFRYGHYTEGKIWRKNRHCEECYKSPATWDEFY